MSSIKEEFKDYINWAIAITLSVSAILFTKDKFVALFEINPVHAVLSICLLGTTVIWFFLYLRAVRHELELLDSAFDSEKIRNVSGYVLPTAILLSVFFGSLIALSENIMAYAGLAALLSASDLYGQTTVNRNINLLFLDNRFKGKEGEEEARILFDYYVGRPLGARVTIILLSLCTAFVLASYAKFLDRQELSYIAYGVVMVVVLGGEILIQNWRRSRDKSLDKLHKQREGRNSE